MSSTECPARRGGQTAAATGHQFRPPSSRPVDWQMVVGAIVFMRINVKQTPAVLALS